MMRTESKTMRQNIKSAFDKMGILPFAQFVLRLLSLNEWQNIFLDLRFYIYNGILTYVPSAFLRRNYLKCCLGIQVGRSSFIHMGTVFSGKIKIGKHSVIGRNCTLFGDITIGDNVSITAETYIFTSSHEVNSPSFECFYKPVVLEDRAWIGARAVIMPGVTMGKGSVLGANSTATKSIPDFSIQVGSPAKEVGKRNPNIDYTIEYHPYFH